MKPSTNVIVGRTDTDLRGYSWNYRERKVGNYLTLCCPLRHAAPGAFWLAWRTTVWIEPRGRMEIRRDTHRYDPECGRRLRCKRGPNGLMHQSYADLRIQCQSVGGTWVPVEQITEDTIRERWKAGTQIPIPGTAEIVSVRWHGYEGERTVFGLPDLDLVGYQPSVLAVVAGCAAQGRFDPLADWLTENSPEPIARLFTEPGEL